MKEIQNTKAAFIRCACPYVTGDNKIDGVVLLVDITELKLPSAGL